MPVTAPVGVATPMAMPIAGGAFMYQQAPAAAPMMIPVAGMAPLGAQQAPAMAVPVASGGLGGVAAPMMATPAASTGNIFSTTAYGVAPGTGPDLVTGLGKTAGEVAAEQVQFAYANGMFEPQDFKPADDDPSRYYPVREVDGAWTQRNRYTIDNLGDCRWFVTDEGYFYAARMPN